MRRPNNDTWVVGAYAATLVAACITSLAIMILMGSHCCSAMSRALLVRPS
jgi:hypothetical protein